MLLVAGGVRSAGIGKDMLSVNRTISPPPPASSTVQGRKFMAGEPMKPATKRV